MILSSGFSLIYCVAALALLNISTIPAFRIPPSSPFPLQAAARQEWRRTNVSPSSQALLGVTLKSFKEDETGEVSSSDQLLLGSLGTFASLVTIYSEYTLFSTGCGLPAGPFGLVGLVEGLSYLGILGIVSYSVLTKIRTGSGLPAGPFGSVGAAEGLSFLAILAGLVVLVAQVSNYGYIPNAVPMEGGMCS